MASIMVISAHSRRHRSSTNIGTDIEPPDPCWVPEAIAPRWFPRSAAWFTCDKLSGAWQIAAAHVVLQHH